jgi:endonuclease YncB( thermonuclease family)
VFVQRQQGAQGARRGLWIQQQRTRPIAFMYAVDAKAGNLA